MKPELLRSHTYHKRIGGPDNAFRYSIDYVLSEPEADSKTPALFSRNRFNLAAVHDTDHGGAPQKGRGAAWVRDLIADRGLDQLLDMRILLLSQPRMFGYLFNPVSFWLLVDKKDNLRAFVAEVNNTYGDRHSYLCHHDDFRVIENTDTLTAEKIFHVSPFQKVGGEYRFRVDYAPSHIGVRIDFRMGNGGLLATLTGKRAPLTSGALLWSAIRRPLGSLRVIVLIHAQAVKLKLKGAIFHQRPEPPTEEVT